jgi:hypothetical protein
LKRVFKSDGNLLLVLGGKSVGKSLVLRNFAAEVGTKNYWPLLINARRFPGAPLSVGILKSYKELFQRELFGTATITEQETLKLMKSMLGVFYNAAKDAAKALDELLTPLLPEALKQAFKFANDDKEDVAFAFSTFIDSVIDNRNVSDDGGEVLESFIKLAKAGFPQKKHPILIIDEANEVLGLGEGQRATSSILKQIVQCTKESKTLDVIMASSEYAYPYLLEKNGLNLNDITKVLFVGEIPPHSMWELLVTKKFGKTNKPVIGMGENLAELLIASYGGHFLRMTRALELLLTEKEFFTIDMALNPISNNITKVLKMNPRKGLVYLRQMAGRGFAPVANPEDPVVEMIVRSNIGGIITKRDSKVVGLPTIIWKKGDTGLIPTSESARNLIAIKVLQFEQERRWWRRIRFWHRRYVV